MNISRRTLLLGLGAAPLAPLVMRAQRRPSRQTPSRQTPSRQTLSRPKLAAICTTFFKYSHAQHIVDRFLEGYGWNGTHHHPEMDLVSIYIDQIGDNDVSKTRLAEFPSMKLYPSIAEALTLGGSKLAVDGVILIGEHGRYPRNEKRRTLYPRYEFFKQIVKVYEDSGRAVPIFNDKHLSYSFEKAKWMVDASRRLKFPMLAGSSLPVTWRLPDIDLPLNCEIESALMVGNGGADVMDFHGLEALQCMVERRKGGETGVRAVQMIEGDAVWRAGEAGRYPKELLVAALSRSDSPQGQTIVDGRTQDLVAKGELQKLVKNPAAYFIEYRDGLKATLLMLNGAVKDFTFAARVKGAGVKGAGVNGPGMNGPGINGTAVLSTQFFLSPEPNVTYSACLVRKIEELFETGKAPYPVERTLLVSGMLESCLTSRLDAQKTLQTPDLDVRYQAPRESQHART